jgi:GON domain-containing protein
MHRRRLLGSAALVGLLAPLLALSAAPAQAEQSRYWAFPSCQAIRAHVPLAQDGNYTLSNNGRTFTVYCHDMAGAPREYIDLANTGPSVNFSQYTAGGFSPGTSVRTTFSKLRVDPATLTVDIGDLTFASSSGALRHGGQWVTSMPYGVAASCLGSGDAQGIGNINLQGTPYRLNNAFTVGGFQPGGWTSVLPGNQVADVRGGGACGWNGPAPALYNPFNPAPGQYHLQLGCAQGPVYTAQRAFCTPAG